MPLSMGTKGTPSVGTPSVYSHSASRSHKSQGTTGLRSSRSVKSLRTPWYKRPVLNSCFGFDVQTLSLYTSFYSFFLSLFTVVHSCMDIYFLVEASPGSTHYGYYIISFDFVYVGNKHVRNCLIAIGVFSLIGGVALFFTSLQLFKALQNEYEQKMVPWLVCMIVFGVWRFFGFIFNSIVNDMIFSYHIAMLLIWIVLTLLNAIGWSAVYSLYLELCDLTKLEDFAHLRMMGTMASLNTQSIAGSRPVTPHSTNSTPVQIPS